MNLWLLTTEYPPFHGGGISTYCSHSANMFAAMGVAVTVFVPDDSVHGYKITKNENGIRLVRFNSDRSGMSPCLGYTARLSYEFAMIVQTMLAQDEKVDIIEAQDYLGIAYYLLQFKYLQYDWIKTIPVLITLHSPAFLYLEYNRVPTYRFPDFWTGEMEKQAIVMANHLVSPTRYLKDAINSYVPISEDAVTIIRNPFEGIRDRVFPVSRNKIVYYGKLSPQKGSFELLAYFKSLWSEGFPHPLHIVGGTEIVYHPERLTMGQLVERDYGEYIRRGLLVLHGKIAPASLEEELKSAHLIIVPSIVDNLPYVVIEAMSLGKIVLASVQGGQREMIDHGLNGFLFDHDVPGDFKKKLSRILALSDEEILAVGLAARQRVKVSYDPAVIGPDKLRLLNSIIHSEKPVPFFPFLHQEPSLPIPTIQTKEAVQKLTVVIPYYNMGQYIEDCIRSIKASSYPGIEILIIDDGSTDEGSIEVLKQLGRDKGVKVYRKQNEGLAETRNFGAVRAEGEFLAFLDADDRVGQDYYEKAIRVLRQYDNVFFAGSWVRYFGESRQKWVSYLPQPPYALVHNPLNSSGLVYKKQAFLLAGLNDKLVDYGLEDYESVINLLANGYNGIVLPEFLFHYRVRNNSMFRKVTREKLLYSYKYITRKHAAYYTKFAPGIINLLNANGPGYLFDNPTFGITVHSTPESTRWPFIKIKAFIKRNKLLKKIALRIIK